MKEKYIFDAVWGRCTLPPLTQYFVDTFEFQRMRNMKQLGTAGFVFSSAEGSRFSHSIGVGHLARTMALHLKKKHPDLVTDRMVDLIQIAGLCHDIGHGPYSHVFDFVVEDDRYPESIHENRSSMIVKYMVEKYNIPLELDEVNFICYTFKPNKKFWMYQIISNEVDVDRMDYLLRDSHNIGVQTTFTTHQAYNIIKHSFINSNGELEYKGVDSDIEDMLYSRQYMYKRIYNHRVSVAINNMIREIFDSVEDIYSIKKSIFNIEEFLKFDDSIIYQIYWNPKTSLLTKEIIDKIFQRKFKEFEQ